MRRLEDGRMMEEGRRRRREDGRGPRFYALDRRSEVEKIRR
jgi:hypothetical protein